MKNTNKSRILTGDTPTGRLHLGHYVGTLENRIKLQQSYDCYFILANKHSFTTLSGAPDKIQEYTLEVATDWLACGIDPEISTMFIQSEIPEIDELTFYFSMYLPFNRVMRNPTLKDEVISKNLGDLYSFGFPLYSVGQTADILAFRPELVPVGKDQLPHVEMTREVAKRIQHLYQKDVSESELLFPEVKPLLGRVSRLPGLTGPGNDGRLPKMSKSLNNAIFLSDNADVVASKIMSMYTDPTRLKATDPGNIENNPLWIFHDAFTKDSNWLEMHKELYQNGGVGDVVIKRRLIEEINLFLDPIRERRKILEDNPDEVIRILKSGTETAREVASETLDRFKTLVHQKYW